MSFNLNMRIRCGGLVLQDGKLLLIEHHTENLGLHYTFPSVGLQAGESLREAARRETLEESGIDVVVGPLVLAYEYQPEKDPLQRDLPPALSLIFACQPAVGEAHLPENPDLTQIGVRWVALEDLKQIVLSPPVQNQICAIAENGPSQLEIIEEWML